MIHLLMQEGDLQKLTSMGVEAVFQPASLYASGCCHCSC